MAMQYPTGMISYFKSLGLKAGRLVLAFIAFFISLMAVASASAAISNPQTWSLVYGGAAYPGTYTYLVPAVKNRLLVVAVSSTRSTAGTQTAAVTYGGQALTLAIGDAATSARQHAYLFYLNEAGMRAASTTNLVVTVTGGTSTYNHVYAAVYAGVNQTTPVSNSRNYNSLATPNTTVGPFASALSIASNDLAVEIINITSSTTNVTRTITGWAANWSSVIGPNAPATNINRPSAYIATSAAGGTTTSQHTADDNCWDSISAMTLNSQVPPAFTSINHTEVDIGQSPTFTVTADGSPAPALSLSGALPSGMTFTPATGILTGAPDPGSEGTYNLTFTAANGVLPNATQNFTLTVTPRFPIDWHYRKCHVINSATGAGTGYQVRITAHYGAGADSGEDVYLNGNCRTDFGDVRFVSSDGVTELDYWMETGSLTASNSVTFWVKVNEDLGAANRTIYIYYGNAAATTMSNGDNTFSFFDDFDDTLSKWVIEKTLDGSDITINAPLSYVRCGGGITGGFYGHTSLGSSPTYTSFTDGAIEMRLKESANALAEIAYRGDFAANTGYKARYDCRTGSESPHMRPPYYGWAAFGTAVTRFGLGTDTWYRGTVTVNTAGPPFLYTHQIFRNGVLVSSVTDATYAGPGEISLQNHYGSYSDYDWVAVRKYVNPEPAHDLWCAEEVLAVNIYTTKSVALANDADGNGAITPGDTMRYNVKIYNTGNVDTPITTLADLLPAQTTYTGAWTATNGTVTYSLGQISWTGTVTADPAGIIRTEITFDVTVNLVPLLTVVSNQGTVSYDADNNGANETNILTDGDPYGLGIQTTDFTVGGSAQATGIKTAALAPLIGDVDGNGVVTPGDILEYTIVITNMTGFTPVAGIEFTDVIPLHTTYVAGSTTVTDYVVPLGPPHSNHTIVINEPSPPFNPQALDITGIDIGPVSSPPDNVVTIKFRVQLDNPVAPGVTQISNQGVGFYDSNSDGVNDRHQTTDGDLGAVGNQPTVTDIYVGTISGTVFDDTNTNTTQEIGEPGLSGVTVELYDAFFTLLYGTTTTDINGYYVFTGTALTPGTYGVRETNPPTYASTTPDDVTVTLANTPSTGDSQTVNFGDHPAGHADLETTLTCQPVFAGEAGQLIFLITIANNGPDAATSVVLTDTGLSAIACLSNINYIIDAGALTPWPGTDTLTWVSLASGESHVIRIFADVDTTPSPCENIVTLTSGTNDPVPGNNASSCTGSLSPFLRGAMKFENPACTACSTACPPGDFHVSVTDRNFNNSLDLGASGTIEAWIQATSCTNSDADAGIVMKGTSAGIANACYGFGLSGGTLFDNSPIEGTPQNIGFRVGDTVLVADGYTLIPGNWYHVACIWDTAGLNLADHPDANPGDGMAIYINGILEKSGGPAVPHLPNDEELMLGQQTIVATPSNGQYFGVIEEFRLWDAARAQADIQNDMCRTLTLPTSGLVCYLKYDEAGGAVAVDASGNTNSGDTTRADRVCSQAPLGDEAAPPDYIGGAAAAFTASFTSSGGETLTVTGDGGAWDDNPAASPPYKSGLQVYRANDAPEPSNGPMGSRLFGDRGYFGVFVTGGDLPTYSVTYTYNDGGIGDEAGLDLMHRHYGCAPWMHLDVDAAHRNTGANTLTQPLMAGTEYILGKNVEPRNAIVYDGADDYVALNASFGQPTDITIELWFKTSSAALGVLVGQRDATAVGGAPMSWVPTILMTPAGNIRVEYWTGAIGAFTTAAAYNDDKWYHLAFVGSTDNQTLYINGIAVGSRLGAGAVNHGWWINTDIGVGYVDAARTGANAWEYFEGVIDEVRVWNTTRSQTDIRNTMCKKVTSADSGFANLMGYWRFDDETNSVNCPDYTANNNDGTMINFGTNPVGAGLDPIREYRVCSSAPIGDDSASSYASPFSTPLAHGDGDYMFATANAASVIAGGWSSTSSGIQVYRVDEAPVYPPDLWEDLYYDYLTPNGLTPPANLTAPALPPPNNWSSIDYYRYWGVFLTDPASGGATEPFYDLMYYYDGDPVNLLDGNPSVPDNADGTAGNPRIGLARRPDYCFGTWTDSIATWNVPSLRLELSNQEQNTPKTNPEYVLGGIDQPLAITLAAFTAMAADNCVNVEWETATEINTAGFHVWRSDNPLVGFVRATDDLIASKSVMETMGATYSFQDCGVDLKNGNTWYYILEEIEIDADGSGNMHGPIGPVSETISAAKSTGGADGRACFIGAMNFE